MDKYYYLDGSVLDYEDENRILHRLDGPAIEWGDGSKFWYKNNQLHRDGKPAIEWHDGRRFWYQDGKLHRLGGPAKIYANGDKEWYHNGLRHRLDGPAIEWDVVLGKRYWFINDKEFTKDEFEKTVLLMKLSGVC